MDSVYIINIERAILSSIIFDPNEIEEISKTLRYRHFYLPAHQEIYRVMLKLFYNDMPIDETFIRQNIDPKIADDSSIIQIMLSNPISNTKAHIVELKEYSSKRQITLMATTIKKMLLEDNLSSSETIEEIEKQLFKISNQTDEQNDKNISQIVDGFIQNYQDASKQKDFIGSKSGIKQIDKIVGSFEDGELIIIGARPSMGKTALACSLALNFIKNDEAVLFDSLEMNSNELMQRFISNDSAEHLSDLKRGICKNLQNLNKTLEYFKENQNLIIQDKSYLNIHQLKVRALRRFRKAVSQNKNIKHWFIDHLRYIKLVTNQPRYLEVGDITKELKKIAKEYGIRIYLLTQLNRANETRTNQRPLLSDLRDSGAIEEDADKIIFIHRESYYQSKLKGIKEPSVHEAEIIIAKNRNGQTGTAKIEYNSNITAFGNYFVEYEKVALQEQNQSIDLPDIL